MAVPTENSIGSESAGFTIICEIIVVPTMNSLLFAFLALIASSFRTRAALVVRQKLHTAPFRVDVTLLRPDDACEPSQSHLRHVPDCKASQA